MKMHVLATRKPIGVLRKAFDADIIAMSREASVSVPKRQPVTQGGHVYEWNVEWQRVLSPSLVIVSCLTITTIVQVTRYTQPVLLLRDTLHSVLADINVTRVRPRLVARSRRN